MKKERLRIKNILRIFLICLLILLFNINVHADTCSTYFDFICYYQKNSVNEIDSFGNNVLNPTVKINDSTTTSVSISIVDDRNNSQNRFYNGDFTNARSMTITVNSSYECYYLEIVDANEESIKVSNSNTLKVTNLPNGNYQFEARCYGESYKNNNSYVGYYTVCNFNFNIDCIAPTIFGASTTKSEYITTDSIKVYATDTLSGVENLYMKKPTDTSFSKVGSSITLSDFDDGIYEFYAKDRVGNITKNYYLIYDSIGPIGWIEDVNGESINSQYVNQMFRFNCSDEVSGLNYIEYKLPNSNEWVNYDGGFISSIESGIYQFRAYDNCGNVSDIYSVNVDTTKPIILCYGDGNLITGEKQVSYEKISFDVLDNESGVKNIYIKLPNSNIYEEYQIGDSFDINGTYILYAYDNAGNRSDNFEIFLDNQAPVISSSPVKLNSSTKGSFKVECSDLSECLLYYKTPSMQEYAICDSLSFLVDSSCESGYYYFFANDILHNETPIYWIELENGIPIIDIVRDYEKNTVYIDWENDDYHVTLNGNDYEKKTIIIEEGSYRVVVEDGEEKIEKEFVIDHLYKVVYSQTGDCVNDGYEKYECISCGDTYIKEISKATGHNITEEIIQEASCYQEGKIHKTCSNCEYEVYEIIPMKNHQYKLIEERVVDGVKEKEYECILCHHHYVEKEANVFDKIIEFIDYLLDNYFKYLVWILLALTGLWSIVLGVMIILARKADEKEKAIKYLRTYIISLILIFVIFLICPLLMKGFIYLIS